MRSVFIASRDAVTLATHPLAKDSRALAMSTLGETTGTPTAWMRRTGERMRVEKALAAVPGITCATPEATFYLFPNATAAVERTGFTDVTEAAGLSVSELARDYPMSVTAVQKHVAVLEGAGLVTKETQGREKIVRGNPERIARVRGLLAQLEALWRARFSQLDSVLTDPNRQE